LPLPHVDVGEELHQTVLFVADEYPSLSLER